MIMGIDTFGIGECVTFSIRLKNNPSTQNAYNRFKNHLREDPIIGYIESKGYGGRGFIRGEDYHVNSIKSDRYWHLIITMNKNIKQNIIDSLRFFDFPKKHNLK